jgi:hypothetical protein
MQHFNAPHAVDGGYEDSGIAHLLNVVRSRLKTGDTCFESGDNKSVEAKYLYTTHATNRSAANTTNTAFRIRGRTLLSSLNPTAEVICRICSAQRVKINSDRAQTMCNTVVHTEQRGGVAEVQRRSGTALRQHLARRVHYVREPEKVRSEGSVGKNLHGTVQHGKSGA